jgi:hypothetical protein
MRGPFAAATGAAPPIRQTVAAAAVTAAPARNCRRDVPHIWPIALCAFSLSSSCAISATARCNVVSNGVCGTVVSLSQGPPTRLCFVGVDLRTRHRRSFVSSSFVSSWFVLWT